MFHNIQLFPKSDDISHARSRIQFHGSHSLIIAPAKWMEQKCRSQRALPGKEGKGHLTAVYSQGGPLLSGAPAEVAVQESHEPKTKEGKKGNNSMEQSGTLWNNEAIASPVEQRNKSARECM